MSGPATDFLCLLRGINVGGNRKVVMARLREVLEELGFDDVRTYINSGNAFFRARSTGGQRLVNRIEAAFEEEFGFPIPVVIWDAKRLDRLVAAMPNTWVDDDTMRTNVLFLWPEVDREDVLERLPSNPQIEDVRYVPGAVLWRIDRANASRSRMTKMVGTDLYRKLSIRSSNTVRKLHALLRERVG